MRRQPADHGRGPPLITSLETTLPPTSREDLLAAGGTVLVFSHDAALASVVKNVAEGRYPLRVINEWQDLIRLVRTEVGHIVMLDVDALTQPVEKALTELNQSVEWLVIVIAAKQQDAQDFMRFWSERRIHRLLIKPAAVGITRLLLESAVARYVELRELHEETDSLEIPPGLRDYTIERRPKPWRKLRALGVLAAAAGGLLVAGYLAFFGPGDAPPPREVEVPGDADSVMATVSPAADAAESPPAVDHAVAPVDAYRERMAAAARAELAGRLVAPAGDNALDYYVEILREAPDHVGAKNGLAGVLDGLFRQAEAQFLKNDLRAAEQTLAHIRRGDPASTRLRFLSEQMTQARATAAALAAAEAAAAEAAAAAAAARAAPRESPVEPRPAAPPPVSSELSSMLTLVARRIEQQQLVMPAGDSARDYLQRAISVDPNDDRVVAAARRLHAALVAAAPSALTEGELDRAEALVAAALELGPTTPELDDLRAAIARARVDQSQETVASLASRAAQRLEQGRLVGDADSALALIAELRALDASHPALGELEAELRTAIPAAARAAIMAESWTRAETLVAAFETAGLDSSAAAALRGELERSRRQAAYLAEASPVGELELLRGVEVEYPRDALQRGTTGWVELNFIVDSKGATRDIIVVNAEPPNVFDSAAIAAVERYRFAPFELDGAIYERRVRARLRFVFDR